MKPGSENVMPSKPAKFQYKPASPFKGVFMRITRYEMNNIDGFLSLAKKAQRAEQNVLERIQEKRKTSTLDDGLADDFAQLEDFIALSSEFAILGLWRCIELYKKGAIRVVSGEDAAARTFKHKDFQKELEKLGITEKRIRCARSVDELRCLNNSIKHQQHVDGELADFPRWRSKKGRKLGNLESEYRRLRPSAER
jgi:hypothetical protein